MGGEGDADRKRVRAVITEKPSLMRRLDESGILLLVIRLFLGFYFIHTGIVKAAEPIDFLKSVRLYGLLPETPPEFLNSTAIVLPWLEIICGIALVLGTRIRGAGLTIAMMMVVFMPAITLRAVAMMRADPTLSFFDVEFDCGCGTGVEIIWIKLCKNTGLFLLAMIVLLSRSRRYCLDWWFDRRRPSPSYCRRCGYTLDGATGGVCDSCSASSPLPTGAADPAA